MCKDVCCQVRGQIKHHRVMWLILLTSVLMPMLQVDSLALQTLFELNKGINNKVTYNKLLTCMF